MEVEVQGSAELGRLARELKDAGHGDLRKALLAGIRDAGKPILADAKKHAAADLPQTGGLAAQVAGSKFAVRTSLAASGASVKLLVTNNKNLIKSTNAGSIRHPVFGNTDVWEQQSVKGGWFSDTAKGSADEFRDAIYKAMRKVAADIERAV